MNKETRQFIFGLILMVLCTSAFLSFAIDFKKHMDAGITYFQLAWDLTMCGMQAFSACYGGYLVLKTI